MASRVLLLLVAIVATLMMSVAVQGQGAYNPAEAKIGAYLSSCCMCNKDTIESWSGTACKAVPGVTEAVVFEKKSAIYSSFGFVAYDASRNTIMIVFRGTDDIADWITNIDFIKTKLWDTGVTVHAGFLRSYEVCRDDWKQDFDRHNATHPDAKIMIVGHSLGGAQATICAVDLTYRMGVNPNRITLYTFGAPRVGADNSFYPFFVSEVPLGRSWRVVHNHDVVPDLPPSYLHFEHVPTEVWYNEDNTEYKVCAPTEDCGPQVNLSTADHGFYVGVHLSCNLNGSPLEKDDGLVLRLLPKDSRFDLSPEETQE